MACCCFADATGCRLGEIQKANIGDVNFDRGTLRVIRKGGKTAADSAEPGSPDLHRRRSEVSNGEVRNRAGCRSAVIHKSVWPAIQQDSRIIEDGVRESESSLHHASFFEAFLRECAQGSETGYRGDFAIPRPCQSDRHSEHLSPLERRSSAWPGAGDPSPAASNRKVAKKCKILKMGLLPMGGVGLSL